MDNFIGKILDLDVSKDEIAEAYDGSKVFFMQEGIRGTDLMVPGRVRVWTNSQDVIVEIKED